MNKKEKQRLKEYKEYLEKEAKKFRLTSDDLSNLTDLELMMPYWFVEDVLKPNKLKEWFNKFFKRVEDITLYDLK